MRSCGVIVEYNPFHNGHVYHIEASKKHTNADCMVAVMSGNFLQRGEPAIIDKWHRADAALKSGIDLVLELPYVFAVQHADLFAKGAILTLDAIGVDTVCFGSENGDINTFKDAYNRFQNHKSTFSYHLKSFLKEGLSFPEASRRAYSQINLDQKELDLTKPNNILGFSYVRAINDYRSSIRPETIKRTKSNYHDEDIVHSIASATSIRKEILAENHVNEKAKSALPNHAVKALFDYQNKTGIFHSWEGYFPYLQHFVITHSVEELQQIQGVEEGLEYRLKKTVKEAASFEDWMHLLKTKRYTWTRLQRMFTNLLTYTKKQNLQLVNELIQVPYVRILGMTQKGREYINTFKKHIEVPMITAFQNFDHPFLTIEEKAVNSYYLPIAPNLRNSVNNRDVKPPIMLKEEQTPL